MSSPSLHAPMRPPARSALAKLLAHGRAPADTGALVLVPEDEAALVEIIGRHLDRDAVAGESLDAVLLHLAGRIGDDDVSGIELNAVARVRQDFGNQAFELDELFLRHRLLSSCS